MQNDKDNLSDEYIAEVVPNKLGRLKNKKVAGAGVLVLILVGFGVWLLKGSGPAIVSNAKTTSNLSVVTPDKTQASNLPGLKLDANKNYGNKYADGIIPVGDGKYSSTAAKKGYVYACSNYAKNLVASQGGAGKRGPWFTNNNTEYDINKKIHVQGHALWQAEFSNIVKGGTRTIVTNDLPSDPTGIFPIKPADPAYVYDRNPNSIKGQTLTYSLSANPTYNQVPTCESGTVGVMLSGVALFNSLDAGGRDAGAWEIQDSCDGHPQSDGIYHYHTLSSCIRNVSAKTVIGLALDGFPITGPQVGKNNILTTADLDECHGLTSQIVLDGKTTTMYHYVMTEDFPYSISCFRGTPITPPDLAQHQQNQKQPGQPGGGQALPGGSRTGPPRIQP